MIIYYTVCLALMCFYFYSVVNNIDINANVIIIPWYSIYASKMLNKLDKCHQVYKLLNLFWFCFINIEKNHTAVLLVSLTFHFDLLNLNGIFTILPTTWFTYIHFSLFSRSTHKIEYKIEYKMLYRYKKVIKLKEIYKIHWLLWLVLFVIIYSM